MKIEKNVLIMSSFPNKITKLFDETFNNKFQIREIAEKYLNTFKMLISK